MRKFFNAIAIFSLAAVSLSGCADGVGPQPREVNIPAAMAAQERKPAVNENSEPVLYLPLGKDVLMPQSEAGEPLPSKIVGPFELRDETLGGALQLILDGTNIPVAFESGLSSTENITVTNLKGPADVVVNEVCSLANMYCSYQNGMLVVKKEQVFTVTIPPISTAAETTTLMNNISSAIGSITGKAPVTDPSTRTIVYRATQRTAEVARRYFQRLRTNTALVVFETYVWEVSLDAGNSTGIRWSLFDKVGKFRFGVNLSGASNTDIGTPVSIGLPTTSIGMDFTADDVLQFVSGYGAVKTISQPQITVLSGSSASLRISDKQNYVASISKTVTDAGTTTTAVTTDSTNSGFTLNISSSWDSATVYTNISILLQELRALNTFKDNPNAVVQLPKTTERELKTQVRGRPGDMLLIAGLVREQDNIDKDGLGTKTVAVPVSRSSKTSNSELVFLLKPRVIVFTANDGAALRNGPPEAPVNINTVATEPVAATLPPVSIATPDIKPDTWKSTAVENTGVKYPPATPPAVEVQPLLESVPQSLAGAKGSKELMNLGGGDSAKQVEDPSVIVNYDVLKK